MKTLLEVLHIYILCTIYIGLYRLSGSLLLVMRQFRVSYSRPSTGLPQGVALLSRDLSPGAPSVTELQFRVARPNWSAVAKHGCKRGQNLAKLTAEEFSLFDNSRPIV